MRLRPMIPRPFAVGSLLSAGLAFAACGGGVESATLEPAPAAATAQAPQSSEAEDGLILPEENGVAAEGRVVFAGQPTAAELRRLQAAGYRVLDLRQEGEGRGFDQAALADEIGLQYENVPVDRAALADPAVHSAFRAAINSADTSPLLVHCASGNRVAGLYYAMLVEERDVPRQQALEQAKQVGLTSPGVKSAIETYLDGSR